MVVIYCRDSHWPDTRRLAIYKNAHHRERKIEHENMRGLWDRKVDKKYENSF